MGIKVTADHVGELENAIRELASTRVMVGIPGDSPDNSRRDSPITNAQLGYIHETGAPEVNLPARPFLVPGVTAISEDVTQRLRAIGRDAFAGKANAVVQGFVALGLLGQNAIRQKITEGPFAPLSPRTIAARRRQHKGRQATAAADVTPLIDTGQLRASLTFAIRKVKPR